MSSLRTPGLGPIVGHTTHTSSRIWIRASDPGDSGVELDPNRRTVGVLALMTENGTRLSPTPVYFFRLHREFDRTGVFKLGEEGGLGGRGDPIYPLKPNTKYTVRVGTLTVDDAQPDDESLADQELANRLPDPASPGLNGTARIWAQELERLETGLSEASFRTFSNKPEASLRFVLGSCRYPGVLWQIKEADRIFGPMLNHAQSDRECRFALMVGDQIYADMLNRNVPLMRADTYREFQERYEEAFSSRNMRRLLRALPTYMILDDHEIEDNWTQDRINKSQTRTLFLNAIRAYMSYQWSHGPRDFGRRLYYRFTCDGFPFFVLDTRTQRYMDDVDDSLDDNHMLGRPSLDPAYANQLDELLRWLKSQDRWHPKFIVTSSVFVPNPIDARECQSVKKKQDSDSWPAFPETRRAVLDCILSNQIQNVTFLSGDIHCSNFAEIYFEGPDPAPKIKAFSVTSSALYWPFSFADGDPSTFVHDSKKLKQEDPFKVSDKVTMHYRAWNFVQDDNFCRITATPRQIEVEVFDNKGGLIGKPAVLQLATLRARRPFLTVGTTGTPCAQIPSARRANDEGVNNDGSLGAPS